MLQINKKNKYKIHNIFIIIKFVQKSYIFMLISTVKQYHTS